MLRPVIRTALTLCILAWALPTVGFSDWVALALASVVLAVLYGFIRPLLKLLLLPINVVTLGLASTLLNVGLLWLATFLVPGFSIQEMIVFGVHLNEFFSLLLISVLIGFLQGLVKLVV